MLDHGLIAGCVLKRGIVSRSLRQHQHRPEGVVNIDPAVLEPRPHHSDNDQRRGMGAGFSVCQRQVVGSAIARYPASSGKVSRKSEDRPLIAKPLLGALHRWKATPR
jgi:hypothetical protein